MKQQGKTWTTADGSPTLVKYVPAHIRLQETIGQRIATAVEAEEKRLRAMRSELIRLAAQVYRNNPDQGLKTSFTFYTFDREYRIVYDLQDFNVRVYRATKANPTSKDYEFIELSFSAFNAEQVLDGDKTDGNLLAAVFDETAHLTPREKDDLIPEIIGGDIRATTVENMEAVTMPHGAHLPKDFNSSLFDEPKQDTAMPDNNERAE